MYFPTEVKRYSKPPPPPPPPPPKKGGFISRSLRLNNIPLPYTHSKDNVLCYLTQDLSRINCTVRVQKQVLGCSYVVEVRCSQGVTCPSFSCSSMPDRIGMWPPISWDLWSVFPREHYRLPLSNISHVQRSMTDALEPVTTSAKGSLMMAQIVACEVKLTLFALDTPVL